MITYTTRIDAAQALLLSPFGLFLMGLLLAACIALVVERSGR